MELITGNSSTDSTTFSSLIKGDTANPTFGTITNNYFRWRQVGNYMEAQFSYSQSTAGANGTGTYYLQMPTGYTVDTSVLSDTSNHSVLGHWFYDDAVNGHNGAQGPIVFEPAGPKIRFRAVTGTDGNDSENWQSGGVPTFNAAISLGGWLRIPILEWAQSKVNLITPQLLGSNDRVKFRLTSTAYTTNTTMDFDTEEGGTTTIGTWTNVNGLVTVPKTGMYRLTTYVRASADWTLVTRTALFVNGSEYDQFDVAGANARVLSGTIQAPLTQGQTIEVRADDTRTLLSASYWVIERVADIGAYAPVGFGIATSNTYGLTLQRNVAFRAYLSAGYNPGTEGVIQLNATEFNYGSAFNTGTYRFVAPYNGVYSFAAVAVWTGNASDNSTTVVYIKTDGANDIGRVQNVYGSTSAEKGQATAATIYLAAGSYVEFMGGSSWSGTLNAGPSRTFMSGHLVFSV
jgi:hypothetical protein